MQNPGYLLIKRKIQNRQNLEHLLSMVKQVPPASARDAFRPAMETLVADELLRHPDIDVKVSITSCISEVMRITAPNQPYDDGRLKLADRTFLSLLCWRLGNCLAWVVAVIQRLSLLLKFLRSTECVC